MIKNYLKIAYRTLIRNRVFTFINVAGLAVGMACCMLIYLFVTDELGYDRFQTNYDSIYRIIYHATMGDDLAQVPPPLAPLLDRVPEVKKAARMFQRDLVLEVKDAASISKKVEAENVYFADSAIVEIFTFNILEGETDGLLTQPRQIMISDMLAEKLFGTVQAVGNVVYLAPEIPSKVNAVFESYPDQSHIELDILAPYNDQFDQHETEFASLVKQNLQQNWVISHSATYLLLEPGASVAGLTQKFTELLNEHAPDWANLGQTFSVEPMRDFHLVSRAELLPKPNGNISYVYLFSAIALFTLLLACFNFVNLSTAQSIRRAREVGLRKVMGAEKRQLFGQFLGESFLVTALAFLLALGLVSLALPYLNPLIGKQLQFSYLLSGWVLLGVLTIYLFTALLGGSYPAFHMTRVNVIQTLKGKTSQRVSRISLRKVLVVLQFAISIALVTGAVVILRQISYLQEKPLGYRTQAILDVPLLNSSTNNFFFGVNGDMRERMNSFEEEVMQHHAIHGITLSSRVIGTGAIGRMVVPEGRDEDDPILVNSLSVDYDFLDVYNIPVIYGRDFDQKSGTDHQEAFIVNEEAIRSFGWGEMEEAIGRTITLEGKSGQVVGIVPNFNFVSLHEPVNSLILDVGVPMFRHFSIAVDEQHLSEIINYLENTWKSYFPNEVFTYHFMDETLREQYASEDRLASIVTIFAMLAVFVSCLGAYGLLLFSVRLRQREIGIRKVMGAGFWRIISLLFKEFTLLYLIGLILAIPAAYYLSDRWLDEFAYKIDLSVIFFLVSGMLALLVLWFTISIQSVRAARINPVKAIRDE